MKRGLALVAFLILLAGLAMIGLAFFLAYKMFMVPPSQALHIVPGEVIDLGSTANTAMQIVVKVVMLILMAAFGSAFANRGIKLFEASRSRPSHPRRDDSD